MAVMQYKRAVTRDKDMLAALALDSFSAEPSGEDEPTALGAELVHLADLVLEYASEREQRIWALQLDLRDLSTSLSDCHAKGQDRQLQSLLVRNHISQCYESTCDVGATTAGCSQTASLADGCPCHSVAYLHVTCHSLIAGLSASCHCGCYKEEQQPSGICVAAQGREHALV
jgi:hypothetical protein